IVFNPRYSIYSPFPSRNLFAPQYDIFTSVSSNSNLNIVISSYSLFFLLPFFTVPYYFELVQVIQYLYDFLFLHLL
ncbi:MAG TPA: hypothetical protein PK528_09665, partial [Syntrophorhabdus sp.]|nr:hypothetical protein [Syntrophorhabdus sp.]